MSIFIYEVSKLLGNLKVFDQVSLYVPNMFLKSL